MTPSRRSLLRLAPLPVLSLGLAACGTTDPARSTTEAGSASDAGGAIDLTDGSGKTVSLTAPAKAVVALEWNSVEDVLTTGGTLVGASDPKGYAQWGSETVTIPKKVTDVGLRTEPSVETIAGLEPDLILGITESIPEGALGKMKKIAPVLLLSGADASRPIELMRKNHLTTGRAVGHEDTAQKNLDDFDDAVSEAKKTLAPTADAPVVFLYPFVDGGQVSFRIHGKRSLPGAVAGLCGLTNAWTKPGDDGWGLDTADLEQLTELPEKTRILYWEDPTSDPIHDTLADNAVWKRIPAVQRGDVHGVGLRTWIYGGPQAMIRLIGDFVDALA